MEHPAKPVVVLTSWFEKVKVWLNDGPSYSIGVRQPAPVPQVKELLQVQMLKNFYVRNLQIFTVSETACPWQAFPAELMFLCNAIGRIFSHVRPFYEWSVSNLERSMDRTLWV